MMFSRIFKIVAYILLLLLVIIAVVIGYAYFSTRPQLRGTLKLTGLHGKVIITRDQYGIPHIQALASDADAFFAQGFVQAQDRFWQMEFQRRVSSGTLSEIFGEATLTKDKFLRTWGFYRAAVEAWDSLDPTSKTLVQSYTDGVNAFLQQGRLPLPFKILRYTPKPWSNIDSIVWSKMMSYDMQDAWQQKLTNYEIAEKVGVPQLKLLLPAYPKNAPTILNDQELEENHLINTITLPKVSVSPVNPIDSLPQGALNSEDRAQSEPISANPANGSNNWVMSGKYTATGKPLLANDPHLDFQAPSTWYLIEMRGPKLHVIGASLPGLPGVVIGHNDEIAWGITNVNPDTQDVYIEPSNVKLQTRTEMIAVRNKPAVPLLISESEHGPIISDVITQQLKNSQGVPMKIALKWTALMPGDTTVESFVKLNYAQNWDEFKEALRWFVVPSQNFVYADRAGNIGYYLPGNIPLRRGYSGLLPIVSDQNSEWNGFIPFDKLPHAYNPAKGWMASANDKTAPDDYPYRIAMRFTHPPYRIERIIELLQQSKKFTVADFAVIQNDVMSNSWRDLKPYLLDTKPLDAASKTALTYLENWNGMTDQPQIAPSIFAAWYAELEQMPGWKLPFAHEWNEPLFIKQQLESDGIYCSNNPQSSCKAYLSASLQTAVRRLQKLLGNNPEHWQWQRLHIAAFPQSVFGSNRWIGWIWNRYIPANGGNFTVNNGDFHNSDFVDYHGPGYRQIIDLANFDNSLFITVPGETENPFSHYYAEFLPLWQAGKYAPMSSQPASWGKTQVLILIPQ